MAQIDIKPPRFLLFVNLPSLMEANYKKYLIAHLRKSFDFEGVPLILELRGKEKTRKPQIHPSQTKSFDRDLPLIDEPEEEEEEE